ncbi:hypothetical protein BCV69DRAFT_23153 [Microstroma glucosiphilum]|uniref:C2H2-type domain-containing protein n=1 Tax=Pseudomicrostroma glucosiphilum TaxID=1684307 RepID=A0A316UH12_9BASI|nr:hypothetical protein BCV69DRAFT_23153 [Pseudomicrostroma glucosiphilum]PWN24214.1 hypothetical protein BCV69DRAFT_23153 [Pseudomicrostroma glucosiphilum]
MPNSSSGFVPPPKGFFSPSPNKTVVSLNNGYPSTPQGASADRQGYSRSFGNGYTGDALAGSEPSSVPKGRSRPRRESIGQMRRKASDSATAAASAGGIGIAFASRTGQPIPTGRGGALPPNVSRAFSTSPRVGADGATPSSFSASLGSAAEALSLPPSVLNSGAKTGRPTGHTHFGQECYGPEPGEAIPPNPPASAEVNKNGGAVPASAPNSGSAAALLAAAANAAGNGATQGRRESISESMNGDEESLSSSARTAGGKELALHRCESCLKVYRHPSCLIKHRWEHTVYWKEASKFLMSKHQQVQLLEAAAILVNLDGDAQSLPDEKALWPAAVSPAASGLLGSDRVNFDKLMQRKAALRGRAPSISSSVQSPHREASYDADGASVASSVPRSVSGGLSPLNSFKSLGLNGTPPAGRLGNGNGYGSYSNYANGNGNGSYTTPYTFGSLGSHRLNSEIAHLALDEESDERNTAATTTSTKTAGTTGTGTSGTSSTSRTEGEEGGSSMGGSSPASSRSPAEEDDEDEVDEDDEEDVSGGSSLGGKRGEKRWGLHEDAIAEMDMDE